jgi:predicted MFS family arabinose efflux permease
MSLTAKHTLPRSEDPESTTGRRRTLPQGAAFAGVAVSFFAFFFAAGAPSPLFSLYQSQWGFPASQLTIAFAIYAIALLGSLLVAGSLSDHIGRRPVLIAALVVEAASMVVFLFAQNIHWIIAARIVQGLATGAAAGAFTAAIVELAPARHKKLGTVVGSVAPTGGLALGALAAGLALQFTDIPGDLLFGSLTVVFVLGLVVVILSPETVSPKAGAARSLIPRVSVTRAARGEFAASIPGHVSTWMLGGLYLGLAPSLIRAVFHVNSGLVNGLAIVACAGTGAVASYVLSSRAPRLISILGHGLVVMGTAIVLVAVHTGTFGLFFVGTVIAGIGFGASFSGALRLIAPLAGAHERAELFAAVYVICYLAFSLPVIAAGQLIAPVGLLSTTTWYVAVVAVLAVIGFVIQAHRSRRSQVEARA